MARMHLRGEETRVISLWRRPLRPITDSTSLILHLITRKFVRKLSPFFTIDLNFPRVLTANFLMSRVDKGAQSEIQTAL